MNPSTMISQPTLRENSQSSYYDDKIGTLKDIFGAATVKIENHHLVVDNQIYPIVNDVIVLLDPSEYPKTLRERVNIGEFKLKGASNEFAEDIQYTFGEEWKKYSNILPEHETEFRQYFDLLDFAELKNLRVCDLGCGIGRWSYFLNGYCREIILIDFSEAIFIARHNLCCMQNTLFFMGNITKLPFRYDFADFIFCFGVLHHLQHPALEEVVVLKQYAARLLIYLYYALDNRPFYFRNLLSVVTGLRRVVHRVRNLTFRSFFTWFAATTLYLPLVTLGIVLRPLGLQRYMPLSEAYSGKSFSRICQDVYDRFFTRIEQRFSKSEILELKDEFSKVVVSEQIPYWHFICER